MVDVRDRHLLFAFSSTFQSGYIQWSRVRRPLTHRKNLFRGRGPGNQEDCGCYEAWPLISSNPGVSKIKTVAVVDIRARIPEHGPFCVSFLFLLEPLVDISVLVFKTQPRSSLHTIGINHNEHV